ncbi:MAG: hypothetical protein ABW201_18255 [Candidatus Thiodiazotropha sp.]
MAVFLLMLGLVFWDWLPMEILHSYKCANKAGFFQDKALEEWKTGNPGVWETLSMHALPEEYFVKEKHGQKRRKRRFYRLPDGTELIAHYNLAGKHGSTSMIRGDGKTFTGSISVSIGKQSGLNIYFMFVNWRTG